MLLVKEGLGASGTSPIIHLGNPDDFLIEMRSGGGTGFNSGTITMQQRNGPAGAWTTYTIDGSNETWTAADRRRYVDGGCAIRFSADSSISDVDIWVEGRMVLRIES